MKVLLGNITFEHNLVEEELELFKTDNKRKALVHELMEVNVHNTKAEAYDEVDNTGYDAWIIPSEYDGEIAFEREADEKLFNSL